MIVLIISRKKTSQEYRTRVDKFASKDGFSLRWELVHPEQDPRESPRYQRGNKQQHPKGIHIRLLITWLTYAKTDMLTQENYHREHFSFLPTEECLRILLTIGHRCSNNPI